MAELITQQGIEAAVQAQVRATTRLLATLREDVVRRLSAAQGFEASRLNELLGALDEGVVRFRADYAALLEDGQRTLATMGAGLVDSAVTTAGLIVLAPDVTQPLLNALGSTRLELVTRISTNLQADLAREIQLGVLGVKPPFEVIQQVQALLDTAGATSYAARAETITRTEVGRAQSQATQEHLEIAERQGVKVQKEWRHSGLARNARSAHVTATGQRVPVREPFLVGGVALRYPRDPAAPPGATVNCRCVAVPYIAG
jgi:hypothetical protein